MMGRTLATPIYKALLCFVIQHSFWNLWLNDDGVLFEKGTEKEGKVLDEVLLIVLPVLEGLPDVGGQR